MKKEILPAVRDEIHRDTQQNAPPHRQDTGTGFTGNTQYPDERVEGEPENNWWSTYVITAGRLVMLQGIAENQVWQIIY